MKKLTKQGYNKNDYISHGNMFLLGNGKYGYKEGVRIEVEKYLREEMKKYFPSNRIAYIV